jgi:hypothetical protein
MNYENIISMLDATYTTQTNNARATMLSPFTSRRFICQ